MAKRLLMSGCRVVSIIRFRTCGRLWPDGDARGAPDGRSSPNQDRATNGSSSFGSVSSQPTARGPVNSVVTLLAPDGRRLCCWVADALCADELDAPVQFDKHYDVTGSIGRRGYFQARPVTWLKAASFHPATQGRLF